MESNLKPRDRGDALDTERFENMLASPPFALYLKRVAAELERARTDCEKQDELRAIHNAQGRCASLRTVLELPAIMLREMRGGTKSG